MPLLRTTYRGTAYPVRSKAAGRIRGEGRASGEISAGYARYDSRLRDRPSTSIPASTGHREHEPRQVMRASAVSQRRRNHDRHQPTRTQSLAASSSPRSPERRHRAPESTHGSRQAAGIAELRTPRLGRGSSQQRTCRQKRRGHMGLLRLTSADRPDSVPRSKPFCARG